LDTNEREYRICIKKIGNAVFVEASITHKRKRNLTVFAQTPVKWLFIVLAKITLDVQLDHFLHVKEIRNITNNQNPIFLESKVELILFRCGRPPVLVARRFFYSSV
jgi:hypothetical protein